MCYYFVVFGPVLHHLWLNLYLQTNVYMLIFNPGVKVPHAP